MTELYKRPAITVKRVAELLDLKFYAANQLIASLSTPEINILHEVSSYQRNRNFVFKLYIDVFCSENAEYSLL